MLFIGICANLSHHHSLAQIVWALGGIAGLIPAMKWIIDELQTQQMGSDILAVLALLGTLLTSEMFASSVKVIFPEAFSGSGEKEQGCYFFLASF